MPNLKTWRDEKNIYSVDMMLTYINTRKHPVTKIPIEELLPQLEKKVWGDWSPMTVLERMETKKYAENAARIREADLSYPIIVTKNHTIIDGYHRVAKAHLLGKKEVSAHVFEPTLLQKCLLVRGLDFMKLNSLTVFQVLELWTKHFCGGT